MSATAQITQLPGPEWLAEQRRAGHERFAALPDPDPSEEVWRYVELDVALDDVDPASRPGVPLTGHALPGLGEGIQAAAVIVDGFLGELSGEFPDSVRFEPVTEAPAAGVHGSMISFDQDRFAAAHRAFHPGGVYLGVPDGMHLPKPFLVEMQATGSGASFPHLTVEIGTDAEASVIVVCRSPEGEELLVVPQIEVVAGDAARFSMTTLQLWGDGTTAIGRQQMRAGRDATIRFGEAGLGGRFSRLHLGVELAGRGSSAEVIGAYFGDRSQVYDYRYFMTHAAPDTNSDMFLKGAVEDEANSVFTGLIRIEEEAQKTNAFQTNRNLVLSEDAVANSVPNLEILANDVRCGHGSTMGPLDEEQRYYLMSRGLDRDRADRLQVRGFFEEAIARLPHAATAGVVRERVNAKFIAAQEEGRL